MRECVAILFVSLSDLQNSNTVNALPTGQNIIVLGKAPLEERSNILAWLQSEPAFQHLALSALYLDPISIENARETAIGDGWTEKY